MKDEDTEEQSGVTNDEGIKKRVCICPLGDHITFICHATALNTAKIVQIFLKDKSNSLVRDLG